MQLLKSIVFSVGASLLGTLLLRRALATTGEPGESGTSGRGGDTSGVVVVIPVVVGNTWNVGRGLPGPKLPGRKGRRS